LSAGQTVTRTAPAHPVVPYTTLFRSRRVLGHEVRDVLRGRVPGHHGALGDDRHTVLRRLARADPAADRLVPAEDLRPDLLLHPRSEEHTSELQSRENLVCRLLLVKKN